MTTQRVERRLAAVLAADVAGYSRLMGRDEVGTLEALKALRREILDSTISGHRGRIVKTIGDGVLVEFASVVEAVTCAVALQERIAERDEAAGPKLTFRIGINVGDVIIEGDDIYGDGVNVAARIENECEPGGVYLSEDAFRQVRGKTSIVFDDLGERPLKNIERPLRIYSVRIGTSERSAEPAHAGLSKPLPLPDKPSVAVLPFQNMSGDPEQEYFADGMVEEIITALSRFKSLFVIARNSSFTYKGKTVDIKQVGRELGVRYVLEGSVRKAGNRVRITGQLIETAAGAHLWAEKFEGSLDAVFELQDQVAVSVVGAIAPRIVDADLQALAVRLPANRDSYDFYMRGMMQGRQGNTSEALAFYRKSIELNPDFALALANAAHCIHALRTLRYQNITEDDRLEALRLAERALKLAPDDAEVLMCAANVFTFLDDDFIRAASLADRAISLNPNLSRAWNSRGWLSGFLGEHERSIQELRHAIRLNPLDPITVPYLLWGQASACFFLRRYEEGIALQKQALLHRPNDIGQLINLAMNTRLAGQPDEAVRIVARIRELHPTLTGSFVRQIYRSRFRPAEDQARLDEAVDALGLPE